MLDRPFVKLITCPSNNHGVSIRVRFDCEGFEMDITKLDFNDEVMLAGLQRWVVCESPSYDPFAVNRMQDLAAHDLAVMGASIERITPHHSVGDCIRARFSHFSPDQPGLLILGHMDTVHPLGTLAHLPVKRDGNLCFGPGICDMKGGNYLALEAIRQLHRIGAETPLPITVLFTSDEEIGSPHTRHSIEAEATPGKGRAHPRTCSKRQWCYIGPVCGRALQY